MIRTLASTVLAVALVAGAAAPVSAAGTIRPAPSGPVLVKPVYVNGHTLLPCVTTTWRAAVWHRPKTPMGAVCFATPDMWVSRYWPRVGRVATPQGVFPVYKRTA